MSCKSCWQLAIIDKGRALHCKIWIKELSLWLNYRYKSVVMLYWWYTRYFYHSVMFLEGINIFQDWDFYHKLTWHILVRLIDFCVDGILNRQKAELKIVIAFVMGCVLINVIFNFSYKSWRLPVIKNSLLIWNRIAYDMQKCFINPFSPGILWKIGIKKNQQRNPATLNGCISKARANS